MGSLSGSCVCTKYNYKKIIGKEVYFGEALGKFSEIYGVITEDMLTIKSEDQDFIEKFEEIMGRGWSTGMVPFDYEYND